MYTPEPKHTWTRVPERVPAKVIPSYIGESGQVANWLFYNGAGDVLFDFSGGKNHGDIIGPKWVDGPYGWALSFDRTDDYVDQPVNVNSSVENITILCWVRMDTSGGWERFFASTDGTNEFNLMITNSDTWSFYTYDGTLYGLNGVGSVSTGVWYFLGAKFHTSNGYTLWVYNNSTDTWNEYTSTDTGFATNAINEFIGARNNLGSPEFYFGGDIHRLFTYKGTALSNARIKTIGNKTMP